MSVEVVVGAVGMFVMALVFIGGLSWVRSLEDKE